MIATLFCASVDINPFNKKFCMYLMNDVYFIF